MKKIVIFGIGGFGREVLDLIHTCNQEKRQYDPIGFIVDPEFGSPGTIINDLPILGGIDWLEKHAAEVSVVCAVGPPHLRRHVVQRICAIQGKFISLIHPHTMEYNQKWVEVGEGVVLNGCHTSFQNKIGDFVRINALTLIGHDTVIGDYAAISPGVQVGGFVTIGTGAFIDTGVILRPNVNIGEWSSVGAGSVIHRDVPPNATAIGFPPRIMEQRESGWHLVNNE